MAVHHRPKRLRVPARITLLLGGRPALVGVMREAGVAGFHAFVNAVDNPPDARLSNESIEHSTFVALEEVLRSLEFEVRVHDDPALANLAARVLRAEASWEAGYGLFVAVRFGFMKRETREALRAWLAAHEDAVSGGAITRPEEELSWTQDAEAGDDITLTISARYYLIHHVRELCGRMARDAGLSEASAYQVVVAADEVITNAFKHGSPEYGQSKIQVRIHVDRKGFWLHVRDEGGLPFDVERYRSMDVRRPEPGHRGIHLVSRFADSWDVVTQPGRSTEFSFFKARDTGKEALVGGSPPAAQKEGK